MRRLAACLCLVAACLAAAASRAAADDDLTLVNLNILHGFGCNPDQCRLADRIDLLFAWIEDAQCPDVVTLQEVIDVSFQQSARALIEARIPTACAGQYAGNAVYSGVAGLDEEMVLSRYAVLQSEVRELHSKLAPDFTRHALWVRIDHPAGPLDVVTTHLSSGSDGATGPCDADANNDGVVDHPCPAECNAAGAATVRECQAVQLVAFVEEKHDVGTPAVVTGDLNAPPGSFEVSRLTGAGYTDTYAAAGNPECVPATGVGCTSGRASSLLELESTAANVDSRIDYAFLVPGATCATSLDPPGDADADGIATRIFADAPNPFAACGAAPSPICWPSDHEGNELDVGLACSAPVPATSAGGRVLLLGLLSLTAGAAARSRR